MFLQLYFGGVIAFMMIALYGLVAERGNVTCKDVAFGLALIFVWPAVFPLVIIITVCQNYREGN